jgi:uncharacterized protein YdeI (YjbR/CyaY-like superfamily)
MATYSKQIDSYISKAEPFARPILEHLRDLIHRASPDIEETIKWSFPHFEYKGVVCSFAAFKQHCSFGFWKGSIMEDPQDILNTVGKTAMGHMGRITSLEELPTDKILIQYIKKAIQLNEDDIRVPKAKPKIGARVKVPDYFLTAIKKNKKAFRAFDAFSSSHKKEYVEWIEEAKTDATREKRIDTAIEWIAEGKSRNWKYARK